MYLQEMLTKNSVQLRLILNSTIPSELKILNVYLTIINVAIKFKLMVLGMCSIMIGLNFMYKDT